MKTRIKQIKYPSGRIEYICQVKMYSAWMIFFFPQLLLSPKYTRFSDLKLPSGASVTYETMAEAKDHIVKWIDQNTTSKKKSKPVVKFIEFPI